MLKLVKNKFLNANYYSKIFFSYFLKYKIDINLIKKSK